MLPDLSVLIALILGLMAFGGETDDPLRSALGSAATVVVAMWMIRSAGRRAVLAARSGEVLLAEAGRRWTSVWAVLGWIVLLLAFQWGALIDGHVPRVLWLIRYAMFFAPAAALFLVAWQSRGRVERAIVELQGLPMPPGLKRPVWSAVRRNGIAVFPVLVFIGVIEGIWVLGELGVEPLAEAARWMEAMPLLNLGVVIGIVILTMPFIPWIFARVLRTRPLEDGPLRTALEQGARHIRLKYREIVFWPTGGTVINAMVVGFTPGTRRIFLTDRIVRDLPQDELMAVFFHEAGHAKRHHLPLLLLLFFSLSMLFQVIAEPAVALGIPIEILVVIHLAVLWYGLLGWVSRRFEREADVYGADHASILTPDAPPVEMPGLERPLERGAALMVRALDRVRRISGRGESHRHGSIDDRIGYVVAHAMEPAVRESFAKSRRNLVLGTLALAAIAAFSVVRAYPTEIAQAESNLAFTDAQTAYESAFAMRYTGAPGNPAPLWEAAYAGFVEAAGHLEGHDDVGSRAKRALAHWNAGDTAIHGLFDPKDARPEIFEKARSEFEIARKELAAKDLGPSGLYLRFQADVELGRIAAWTRQPEADARRYLRAAESNPLARGGEDAEPDVNMRRYYSARLRLLAAVIEAHYGGESTATAIDPLRELTTSKNKASWWVELRADAQLELDRLLRIRAGG